MTEKFDDIFSRLDTIHQRDGRTPGDNQSINQSINQNFYSGLSGKRHCKDH